MTRESDKVDAHCLVWPGVKQSDSAEVRKDRRLVDRCLQGEQAAWDQLYERYHPPLLVVVSLLLGRLANDEDLVEEIAARVWYALLKDQCRLLDRFDVRRHCRLSTFIAMIAKSQVRQYSRAESRRRKRERLVSKMEVEQSTMTPQQFESLLHEFSACLTPREKDYLHGFLLGSVPAECQPDVSNVNQWQLAHRIRKKLRAFARRRHGL